MGRETHELEFRGGEGRREKSQEEFRGGEGRRGEEPGGQHGL